MKGLERRLMTLEKGLAVGKTLSTDDEGRPVYLEPGGLTLAFRLMEIQDEGGEIPADLQQEARLWSRVVPESPMERAVKELCEEVIS